MTSVHVAMIMRNEKDRHLSRSLPCAASIAERFGGKVFITDDCSDDGTAADVRRWAEGNSDVHIRQNRQPMFMHHEGRARQAHLDWAGEGIDEGDWVLSLDADETINNLDALGASIRDAWSRDVAILMPLYEFWMEDPLMYRVDGFWFGTLASRLFRWKPDGLIRDREFGCGSEPTYVNEAVRSGDVHRQNELHLLHWGYVNKRDRIVKHDRYTTRIGGHGHSNAHVNSIIDENPRLHAYEEKVDW